MYYVRWVKRNLSLNPILSQSLTISFIYFSYATWLCVCVWVSMFAIWILDFILHLFEGLYQLK